MGRRRGKTALGTGNGARSLGWQRMMALLEVTGMKMVVLLAGGKGAWLLGATGMKTAVLIASRGRDSGGAQQRQKVEGDEMLAARR